MHPIRLRVAGHRDLIEPAPKATDELVLEGQPLPPSIGCSTWPASKPNYGDSSFVRPSTPRPE